MKNENLILYILLAVVLLGGGTVAYIATRGIRNNNPGNIRHSGTQWLGMSKNQTDDSFIQFDKPEYGIRAMARIIANYQKRGIRTIEDIINTWAPPSENDSQAYIDDVSNQLDARPEDTVTPDQVPALIAAIIRHENGVNPYPEQTIINGIAMA